MKKGFTLVELLAVIVILAVILVIAVPQISKTIKQTKMNSLGSTAKLIASKAEEKKVENQALGSYEYIEDFDEMLSCDDLVKLDDNYENCIVRLFEDEWTVLLTGADKFAGISCVGTKNNMNCVEEDIGIYAYGSISSPSEGYADYHDVKYPNNSPARVFIGYPKKGPYTNNTIKSVCTRYDEDIIYCFKATADAYEVNSLKLALLSEVYGNKYLCGASPKGSIYCHPVGRFCSVNEDGSVYVQ